MCAPTPYSEGNHQSGIVNGKFVTDAIRELIIHRCVTKVSTKPFVCSPLSVVANTEGKLRLVLNLKHLKQFLHKYKFKYKDLQVVLLMFQRDNVLFKFDLKSGYHHVNMHKPHQKYLGFAWETGGVLSYYIFMVLPFGLSSACYAFTKLLRPLVRYWRGQGM